jgi:hypothetical protein
MNSIQDASLRLVDRERKVVGGDGHDFSQKGRTDYIQRSKRFKDTWDLAAAAVCLMLLLLAVRYADLDSSFATSVALTSSVRQMLGLPAFGSHASKQGGKLILVAENDNGQRLIAKTTLERYGYGVALADSGSQAVDFFRKASPRVALVLLDRAELRSSVDTVVYELKRIRPDIRILVFQRGDERLPWGVAGSLAEPLSAQPLTETVRRVLGPN